MTTFAGSIVVDQETFYRMAAQYYIRNSALVFCPNEKRVDTGTAK